MHHLDVALTILVNQSFFAKIPKCELRMTRILYLDYVIGQGVEVHMENILVILDW